uniref:Uncharacterized protein n=1 Tax=Arundo donax TaxID=35708 RepID=A0A0A9F9H0_ARUDO
MEYKLYISGAVALRHHHKQLQYNSKCHLHLQTTCSCIS